MIDWAQWAVTCATVLVPTFIYVARNKQKAKAEQDARHQENQRKLDDLLGEQEERPSHQHIEKGSQPLTADGIRYKPKWQR